MSVTTGLVLTSFTPASANRKRYRIDLRDGSVRIAITEDAVEI